MPSTEPVSIDTRQGSFIANSSTGADDARSTANDTEGGATGTTQHFTFETNLAQGDYAELRLWQAFDPHRGCDVYFQMRRVGG